MCIWSVINIVNDSVMFDIQAGRITLWKKRFSFTNILSLDVAHSMLLRTHCVHRYTGIWWVTLSLQHRWWGHYSGVTQMAWSLNLLTTRLLCCCLASLTAHKISSLRFISPLWRIIYQWALHSSRKGSEMRKVLPHLEIPRNRWLRARPQ